MCAKLDMEHGRPSDKAQDTCNGKAWKINLSIYLQLSQNKPMHLNPMIRRINDSK